MDHQIDQEKPVLTKLVQTNDGSLTRSHPTHGETYHSSSGAAFEAENLYIAGSDIRKQFCVKPLTVLDVGLGLGYNALTTINAWLQDSEAHDLAIVSLEIDRALFEEFRSAKSDWQKTWNKHWLSYASNFMSFSEASSEPEQFHQQISHPNKWAKLEWRVLIGDAQNLASIGPLGKYHFVWQDAFSPKNNPVLWNEQWFRKLHSHAHADCTLMTYSVARRVRDSLNAAGWNPQLIDAPGGTKRNWLKAYAQ